mmetsp:Transcript_35428/g.101161  ORF Transcript_35428/g.101161 Transcript_35428/m.101161 type:complete len:232 (-) Transcript_35428:641-1336(-)
MTGGASWALTERRRLQGCIRSLRSTRSPSPCPGSQDRSPRTRTDRAGRRARRSSASAPWTRCPKTSCSAARAAAPGSPGAAATAPDPGPRACRWRDPGPCAARALPIPNDGAIERRPSAPHQTRPPPQQRPLPAAPQKPAGDHSCAVRRPHRRNCCGRSNPRATAARANARRAQPAPPSPGRNGRGEPGGSARRAAGDPETQYPSLPWQTPGPGASSGLREGRPGHCHHRK